MGVKQETLQYVDYLKENQSQSTLTEMKNEVKNGLATSNAAGSAIEAIKILIAENDDKLAILDEFKASISALPDPEE